MVDWKMFHEKCFHKDYKVKKKIKITNMYKDLTSPIHEPH